MTQLLTREQFQDVLPAQMRNTVNQEIVDKINTTLSDPDTAEMLREHLVGYTSVMTQGKFKLSSYIDAVKYVSYKLMGDTNLTAYTKTFPARYQDFVARGVSPKDIASYVTAYNKGKLVNLILEQTLVPTYILNADIYQKAINVQAEIMMDQDVAPKVRSSAADSILNHLKRPEAQKLELNVTSESNSAIADLRSAMANMVQQQKQILESGSMTAQEMAHAPLDVNSKPEEEIEEAVVTPVVTKPAVQTPVLFK